MTNPAERLAAREVYDSDGTALVLPKIEMTDAEGDEYNALYTDIQTYVQEKRRATSWAPSLWTRTAILWRRSRA